jgi:hypothetical protein
LRTLFFAGDTYAVMGSKLSMSSKAVYARCERLDHFRVSLNRENDLGPCIDAFSSREPVSTSLENALGLTKFRLKTGRWGRRDSAMI